MGKPFADLVQDPKKHRQALEAFTKAIRQSFETHPVRHQTQAEIKRRFDICEKWYRTLRGDKQWGFERALDGAVRALASELSGIDYVPSSRALWLPGA